MDAYHDPFAAIGLALVLGWGPILLVLLLVAWKKEIFSEICMFLRKVRKSWDSLRGGVVDAWVVGRGRASTIGSREGFIALLKSKEEVIAVYEGWAKCYMARRDADAAEIARLRGELARLRTVVTAVSKAVVAASNHGPGSGYVSRPTVKTNGGGGRVE